MVGGMNHFMLPDSGDDDLSARYGVNAMELLINRCMKKGADRKRLEAKVFGGGHVLKTRMHHASVPQRNIQFAVSFLQDEQIPILKQDVGGLAARSVLFFTDSGRVFMKRLRATGSDAMEVEQVSNREVEVARQNSAEDDRVTLF
ncbi:MAG: Chemoreceptor glutamine deamidase CheD [Fimbriimonadaceae bacterium]|nr:Chemoreceptor glutamine deamidase CheD [Fimbriimonadaceae bacterium]